MKFADEPEWQNALKLYDDWMSTNPAEATNRWPKELQEFQEAMAELAMTFPVTVFNLLRDAIKAEQL